MMVTSQTPREGAGCCGQSPYRDYRDLCIEQLADELHAMTDRAIDAEVDRDSYRRTLHVCAAILAKTSYQRDQAYARLGFGQGDEFDREDAA
jgi:hypothetical protein